MINHFISKPTRLNFEISSPTQESIKTKDPIDEFKEYLNDIKINLIKANVAIKNIEKTIEVFDKTKHSSEKFKNVIEKFKEKLRLSLKKTNIDMMYMDTIIDTIEKELII